MIMAIPMEDWLRGCIYHDGRHGYVTLPIDKVHQIANYIQRTRRSTTDGLIDLKVVETDRKTENSSVFPNNFAKDINVRSKDEQTDCNGCKFVGTYDTEFPCANCSRKTKDYYAKEEPTAQEYEKWLFKEPQTERSKE